MGMPTAALSESSHRETTTNDHKRPIRIGIMMTLTGNGSHASQETLRGFTLYCDTIGNTVAGRKLELIIEDDENSPEAALVKMNKLITKDHIDIFAGLRYSPITYLLAPRIDEQYKLPFVVMISSGDSLTSNKHPKWLVRTEFSNGQLFMPLGDYAYRHMGLRRIATVGARNAWASEGVSDFQKSFEHEGGRIVQSIWVARDATDVSADLSKLRQDIDGVFQMTDETNSLTVAHGLRHMGIKVPILSHGGLTDTSPPDPASLPNYTTAMTYADDIDNPANKEFVSQYQKQCHANPTFWTVLGYTTAMILRSAIDTCKGDVEDKEQVLRAIRNVQVDGPAGHEKFDEYGQLTQNIYVRKTSLVDGKLRNTVIFTYPHVSQFWTFGPPSKAP
jgi:branched-chain amino acid transport system substrate-binding protein